MIVIGSFMQTMELETALTLLEHHGIQSSRIVVVPMSGSENIKASIPSQTGTIQEKAFEIGIAVATALGVIGTSIGFSNRLGPLLWGLIFAFGGGLITFFIAALCMKKKQKHLRKRNGKARAGRRPELTVMIECEPERADWVSQLLWEHEAMAVGRMGENEVRES
ncbi:hypothetical protein [Paenibacillus soyae]|uniref:Uncharacterized protein n=1 Tax=Paenibacillus soyae TaxID=2969249 RepID=A0A9X2MV58_9BACL|nr:hypothetical protein [Paenibacillus soyae]MCR2806879.1 hypothetical protein [Paenibacillus soyae]